MTFLALASGGVPLAVLLVSGLSHLGSLPAFVGVVRRQRVILAAAVPVVAAAVTAAEILLPLAVGFFVLQGRRPAVAATLFAVAGLYALFAIHVARLVQERPGVACGCGVGTEPANYVTLLRAVVLGLAAVLAGATVHLVGSPGGAGQWAVLGVAVATFSTLSLGLPAALHLPGQRLVPIADGVGGEL